MEKWLSGPGYFALEIWMNLGDNIREINIKIRYPGWFRRYIRWRDGGDINIGIRSLNATGFIVITLLVFDIV